MYVIGVNNEQKLALCLDIWQEGMHVETLASDGTVTRSDFIPEDELVMLYNYWTNCKDGTEKSDYIAEA